MPKLDSLCSLLLTCAAPKLHPRQKSHDSLSRQLEEKAHASWLLTRGTHRGGRERNGRSGHLRSLETAVHREGLSGRRWVRHCRHPCEHGEWGGSSRIRRSSLGLHAFAAANGGAGVVHNNSVRPDSYRQVTSQVGDPEVDAGTRFSVCSCSANAIEILFDARR